MKAVQEIDLNVKSGTQYCVPLSVRDWQIRTNTKKVAERIQPHDKRGEPIAIVGFGPSLQKTWKELRKFKAIITCSGAHKFLLSKGIVPTYHLDVDPRAHKLELLGEPNIGVTYLPASCVHPSYIDKLTESGAKVILWHVFARDGESDQVIPPGEYMVTGGSDAGMRCMTVARFLGYTDFHIFGLDGSDAPTGRHAGKHPNQHPGHVTTTCNGRKFNTTPALIECGKQVFHELDQMPDVSYRFYGDGLIQEMAKTYVRKPKLNATIAAFKPTTISDEMRELNRRLHEENAFYGVGGEKYAETVLKMKTDEITSILDYGAGKGTLSKALPFPIWNYDPAIPEYSETPRPADLVVCTDVLEHIEPDKLRAVLEDLRRCVLKVGYFVIHLGAAKKTYADGRNAHLIQESADWWAKKLSQYFDIGTAQQHGNELHVVVGPKTVKEYVPDIIGIRGEDNIKSRFYIPNEVCKWRAETLGVKEPVTVKWIESLPKGSVLWDIGANVGGYSVWAGVRGIETYSFEPESENFNLLCRNLSLNNLPVRAFCVAVTDNLKAETLFLSQRGAGGSCHSFGESVDPFGKPREAVHTQNVLGMNIDALCAAELPAPDYIKIDVDGFEPQVIAGAAKTLEKVQGLLIEINPATPGHTEMVEKLQSLGFAFDPAQVAEATRPDGAFAGVAEHVFYRLSDVERHLIGRIAEAEVISEPYPHMYIENVFPEDWYENILSGDIEYKPILEVRHTNYPDRFVGMKEFPELTRGTLAKALCDKFGVRRFNTREETLLIKDRPGYAISPHTDLDARILSAIFYLAKDNASPELGTTVYTPKVKGFTSDGTKHLPFGDFDAVKTLPYKRNAAFVFLRTDNSFHGVEKTEKERNVLLYDIRK